MTNEEFDRTVITERPADPAGRQTVETHRRRSTLGGPEPSELTRRLIILAFGLIQLVIGLRIVLLVLDAREANSIVSAILDISQLFVAPFEGILRTDALRAAGSVLDVSAVVAIVGWTILEAIVLAVVGLFRREPV